jgi:VWFA-related protein
MRLDRFGVAAAVIVIGLSLVRAEGPDAALQQPAAQQPTFRSTVDVVAVDVQVINRDGIPIPSLGPEKFEVTIGGKRRRVVSADFIQSSTAFSRAPGDSGPPVTSASIDERRPGVGRVFMLAVDVASFSVGASRGVVQAARGFVANLEPEDEVGLVAYPVGPSIASTTDHGAVARRLDTIVGQLQSLMQTRFNLSVSEIVDISSEATPNRVATPTDAFRRVQERECGTTTDLSCADQLSKEALSMGYMLEGQVTESLSRLQSVLVQLGQYPGRKTVIVLSGGMPAGDRPGGRPGPMTELARAVGEDAARANATLYAIHIDSDSVTSQAAERRRPARQPVDQERESAMQGRLLDQMAGSSGGTMLRVLVGSGEGSLDRVLRETSSHYLLGIEPETADRDGRLRDLRVRVSEKGATVRSRTWVVVPKKRG